MGWILLFWKTENRDIDEGVEMNFSETKLCIGLLVFGPHK
jgi:hypothetical protein